MDGSYRIPRLESRHENSCASRSRHRAWNKTRSLRNLAATRYRLLAERRQAYPSRPQSSHDRARQKNGLGNLRRCQNCNERHPTPTQVGKHSAQSTEQQRTTAGRNRQTKKRVGRRTQRMGTARRITRIPATNPTRTRRCYAQRRYGHNRYRKHLFGRQLVPALRKAAELLRCHELRKLRIRLSHRHRREGRLSVASCRSLCRRRSLGDEPARNAHLRARKHSRHRRRLQQRTMGGGEKEPNRFLRRSIHRHQPHQPLLCQNRTSDGR